MKTLSGTARRSARPGTRRGGCSTAIAIVVGLRGLALIVPAMTRFVLLANMGAHKAYRDAACLGQRIVLEAEFENLHPI